MASKEKPNLTNIKSIDSTLDELSYALITAENGSLREMEIERFFEGKPYDDKSMGYVSTYEHHKLQWVMKEMFEEVLKLELFKLRSVSYDGEKPPVMQDVEHAPGKTFKAIEDALSYYLLKGENGEITAKIIVAIHFDSHSCRYSYNIYSCGMDASTSISKKWNKLANEKNFYKGQKISCDCRFLELSDISWEDVILPPKTLKVIQDNVTNVFEDSAYFKKFNVPLKRGIILQGDPGTGKAQPLDSIIYTPSGPITMGEVKVGTKVLSPMHGTSSVSAVFPQGEKDIYRITFSDGDSVECCEDHLWLLQNRNNSFVEDTKYIIKHYQQKCGYHPLWIECPNDVEFDKQPCPIDPYLLGILIGDGNLTNGSVAFCSADEEIVDKVKSSFTNEYEIHTNTATITHKAIDHRIVRSQRSPKPTEYTLGLRELGLWGLGSRSKFIPKNYKYNSSSVRIELMRGLMDSDGYVDNKTGMTEITVCSEQLALDIKEVISSLGGICRITIKTIEGHDPCYRCFIRYNENKDLFSLSRKQKIAKSRTKYKARRVIANVEYVGKKQAQCIMVDSPSHLYLTNNFVITHNTQICKAIAKNAACSVVYALPQDFSPNRGGVNAVCGIAKDLAPCILIIEDIDWIAQDRHEGNSGFVIQLMNQLDGLESFGDIVTIGTTNHKSDIENAVKNRPGRFDRLISVGNPDLSCRTRMIEFFTRNSTLKDVDIPKIAKVLEGLSGAHIKDLCTTASMFAIRARSFSQGEESLVLTGDHFKAAIKEIKNKDFSSYQKVQNTRNRSRRLGFNQAIAEPASLEDILFGDEGEGL